MSQEAATPYGPGQSRTINLPGPMWAFLESFSVDGGVSDGARRCIMSHPDWVEPTPNDIRRAYEQDRERREIAAAKADERYRERRAAERARETGVALTPRSSRSKPTIDDAILRLIQEDPYITIRQIAQIMGGSQYVIENHYRNLRDAGAIRHVDGDKQGNTPRKQVGTATGDQ